MACHIYLQMYYNEVVAQKCMYFLKNDSVFSVFSRFYTFVKREPHVPYFLMPLVPSFSECFLQNCLLTSGGLAIRSKNLKECLAIFSNETFVLFCKFLRKTFPLNL